MATATRKAAAKKTAASKGAGYDRVPAEDVWASDEEVRRRAPNQRYDWVALGDKAVEGAKTKPLSWLLVSNDAPSSIASNITGQRIATLSGPRFVGWKFRGRMTHMTPSNPGRGKCWIRAEKAAVEP
jgi:hypothetical protein